MRQQINFFIIFVFGFALILFSLENIEPTTVNIVQGVNFTAPLSVELILAMGVGAVLAWLFSVWSRLQDLIVSRKGTSAIRQREARIKELEQDIESYKIQIEEQQDPQGQLPPAAEAQSE